MRQFKAIVRGRVQGVFFRQTTAEQARALRLTGFVRNLPSGEVEVLAEGPEPELRQLEAFLHHGPPYARVDDVEARWGDAQGVFRRFEITG
jgi:acylphosphatase